MQLTVLLLDPAWTCQYISLQYSPTVIEQDRTEKRATTQCMVHCISNDSRKQLAHPGTHLRNDSHGWATDITGTHTANLEVKITHFDRIE
jgi:hypothetical protein